VKCSIDDWCFFLLVRKLHAFILAIASESVVSLGLSDLKLQRKMTTGQTNAHALVVNRDAYVRDAWVLSW